MMTALRRLYAFLCGLRTQCLWRMQSKRVGMLTKVIQAKAFQTKDNIIVIAPHADDELIGCHQLISNHPGQVTIFYCGFLGSNPAEYNRITRENEIISYAKSQKCALVISAPVSIETDLQKTLKQVKPGYVFLPSYVDWHDEHREINVILSGLVQEFDFKIGLYHVSLPMPGAYVTSVSDMDLREHKQKWDAMKEHYPSQLHMNLNRFEYIERLSKCNKEFGETYRVMEINEYCTMMDKLSSVAKGHFDSLKSALGNIEKMYRETNNIYSTL